MLTELARAWEKQVAHTDEWSYLSPHDVAAITALVSGASLAAAREREAWLVAMVERLRKALERSITALVFADTPESKAFHFGDLVTQLRETLAATPADSLAAHDAAQKEPSAFLPRAAWRVVKEVWIDVSAGRMNARSAIADAALDLRGLLEESGPEPPDEVVGVKRKAQAEFTEYLAAHDAALLREVADREFNPEQSAEERWAHGVLHGNADRIEKEAQRG